MRAKILNFNPSKASLECKIRNCLLSFEKYFLFKKLKSSFLVIIFVLMQFISGPALALGDPKNCGVFLIQGVVKREGSKYFIVTAEYSKSENKFTVNYPKDALLYGFEDLPIQAILNITEAPNGTLWKINKILDVSIRTPDHLNEGSHLVIQQHSKTECGRVKKSESNGLEKIGAQ